MINEATALFISEHLNDDVRKLALAKTGDGVDMMVALTQIEGYQIAVRKLPSWAATKGIVWPRKLSLEQCSSEATATYKHDIVKRMMRCLNADEQKSSTMADLTGGLGVDFAAMATLFDKATYVEQQPELCELAQNNLACLGLHNFNVVCGDGNSQLTTSTYTLLYLDPARRDTAGRKVALIEDCQPDVCRMQDILARQTRFCMIKLSPMLDITAALRAMRCVREVHVVGYQGECKELLLVIDYNVESDTEPTIHCVDLPSTKPLVFTRTEEEQQPFVPAATICSYLYEPSPALLKAGAYKTVARHYGLQKLAPMTHLYTSDTLVTGFQGRTWKVTDTSTFAKHDLRRMLAGIHRAELSVRGFPMSVAQLRKQLHLREGGDVHLIATTMADGSKILIKLTSL